MCAWKLKFIAKYYLRIIASWSRSTIKVVTCIPHSMEIVREVDSPNVLSLESQ